MSITIIDIIDHRDAYGVQRQLVVDRMPEFVFERRGANWLIGHDSGFFQFYKYDRPGPGWKAFAGLKFDIRMADGSVEKAHGQWWDARPTDFYGLTHSLGVNTIENLEQCYVFRGGIHVDRELVDAWLAQNATSNNYHKYNASHDDYGKDRIVSPWESESCN